MDVKEYDALIMVTPTDYLRLESQYLRLLKYLPVRKIIFIGNSKVGELVKNSNLGDRVGFLYEEDLLSFDLVHSLMKKLLKDAVKGEIPRGVTGWYYQQFLKMQYSYICKDEYYLVWDGDTVPCKEFSMFQGNSEIPYLDLKTEYHEDYFVTLTKLLPSLSKCIEKSFIAEHMLIRCDIMKKLIEEIESNTAIQGKNFWEKIFYAVGPGKLTSNSFSEFETYGCYVAFKYLNDYRLRDWHSFRYAGEFFELEKISERDFKWLGKDFFAVSFEKGNKVREDHKNLFDNPEYQKRLSARQMLEIAQQEFGEECYHEIWDLEKEKARLSILEASKCEESGDLKGMFEAIRVGLFHDCRNYELYYMLAFYYLQKNINQAFLCMQNALFYCNVDEDRKIIENDMIELKKSGQVTVKDTAFVIVSYNSTYLMEKNLESIKKTCNVNRYPRDSFDLEAKNYIIVVDNASTDGVTEWLKLQDDIILIMNSENKGFATACNQGAARAYDLVKNQMSMMTRDGEVENLDIFLLNNDTRLSPNALFWSKMGLYESDDIGATGCISNYAGNKQELDLTFSMPEDYIDYAKSTNLPMEFPYEERVRLSGFAMLIKSELWNLVGGMDESFNPGYFEDDDLCMKLRQEGYRLLICKNSFVYHAGSQSFAKRADTESLLLNHYSRFINKYGSDIVSLAYPNSKFIEDFQVTVRKKRKENIQDSNLDVLIINCGLGAEICFIRSYYPYIKIFGVESNRSIANIVRKDFNIYNSLNEIMLELVDHKIDILVINKEDGMNMIDLISNKMNENTVTLYRTT